MKEIIAMREYLSNVLLVKEILRMSDTKGLNGHRINT